MFDDEDYKFIEKLREQESIDVTNPAGRKRPVRVGPRGKMTPVPWMGGDGPDNGSWANIDLIRATEATHKNLCVVCGTHRGDNWVYALLFGEPYDRGSTYIERLFGEGGSPSPTYGHPGCILLAALYCPHLQVQEYPAMMQDKKTKLSVSDLKRLAKDDKPKRDLVMGVGNYGVKRSRTKAMTSK